ncbi:hypothetical protein LCGC14_2098190 [marine sediment metagenome]|uniref:Uncharacterized protein n=1 Tax=marine sediment metagenome TaxID=412755 RepID=A0A0F9EXX8_9ZZZZ
MEDTDTNGADLRAITILPPDVDTHTHGAALDVVMVLSTNDDDTAAFAAKLGWRARKRRIELGEL